MIAPRYAVPLALAIGRVPPRRHGDELRAR
jgi:hypothetical protein